MGGTWRVEWCAAVGDDELVALTAVHDGRAENGWWDRVRPHSLGWASARDADGRLAGFANVAWDGGAHAFLLDPTVHPDHRRHGLGTALIARCRDGAAAAGCEWLHVDFEPHLRGFYLATCGFAPTDAGLIRLHDRR